MKETMNKLYAQFRKPLLYFITSKVRDKNIAEDLLQEVFIKAYNNFSSLKEKDKVQSWLYKIATNIVIDYVRKKQVPNIENTQMHLEEELQESILNELSCCLKTCINTLPNTQKNVLEAVYFNEMTLVEYSNTNNLNLSTVKSHAKRAKHKIKDIFNKFCTFQNNHMQEIVDYQFKDNDTCICKKD